MTESIAALTRYRPSKAKGEPEEAEMGSTWPIKGEEPRRQQRDISCVVHCSTCYLLPPRSDWTHP